MRTLSKILIAITLLGAGSILSADSLINKKTGRVKDLGHAKIEEGIIHWTPCFSETATNYRADEYRVLPGENCLPQDGRLPQTASPLPLIGVLALVFVATGLAMLIFGKTLRHRPNAS